MIHLSTGDGTILPDCISMVLNENVVSGGALSGAELPVKIHGRRLPLESLYSPCNFDIFYQFISMALVSLH